MEGVMITRMEYRVNGRYTRIIERENEGGHVFYMATCPEIPGCKTHGYTVADAYRMLDDAVRINVEHAREFKLSLPKPLQLIPMAGTCGAPNTMLIDVEYQRFTLLTTRWQRFSNWFWFVRYRIWGRLV